MSKYDKYKTTTTRTQPTTTSKYAKYRQSSTREYTPATSKYTSYSDSSFRTTTREKEEEKTAIVKEYEKLGITLDPAQIKGYDEYGVPLGESGKRLLYYEPGAVESFKNIGKNIRSFFSPAKMPVAGDPEYETYTRSVAARTGKKHAAGLGFVSGITPGFDLGRVQEKAAEAVGLKGPEYSSVAIAQQERPGAYTAGKIGGSLAKYGALYSAAGPAVEKAVSPLTGKIASPFLKTMAVEGAKDIAIGGPLGVLDALGEGKKGLAGEAAKNLGYDVLANVAFYGIGKGAKALRKALPKAKPVTEASKAIKVAAGIQEAPMPGGLVEKGIKKATSTVDQVVKRSEIEKFISDSFDIPVAQGKFRQKAYGIFKQQPEVIRLKHTKDLDTLYHELGHFLDKKFQISTKEFGNELQTLGSFTSKASYSKKQVDMEGVAEFMRHYIIDPDAAKKQAPKLYEHFEGILKKDSNLSELISTVQQATKNYMTQTPEGRILSNISIGDKPPKLGATKERISTLVFDELAPIKRVTEEITGGKALLTSENPFELSWLNRGWQGKAETFLKYGTMDENFKKIGKSFDEIISKTDNLDKFRAYAVAKRARELAERGIETGIRKADIDAVLAAPNKVYDAALKELVEYQNNVLYQLIEQEVISAADYTKIKELNKEYIPFYRVIESFGRKGKTTGTGLKRIKGSTRDIVDPLESIIKNTYVMTNIAEQNRIGKALVDLADKFEGTGKFFDKVPPDMAPRTVKLEDIKKALEAAGADVEAIDLDTVATLFRPANFQKGNIITVFKKGKPQYYEVFDEALYRSLQSMDRESTGVLTRLMSMPAKLLRAGATLTPEFVARNPVRDAMTAFVYSKYGFVPGVDTARGLFHAIKKDDLYYKWMASGGAHGTFYSLDRDYLQKNLRNLMAGKMKDKALNIIKNPIDAVRAFSEFTEEATRLGEFAKGVKKEGLSVEGIRRAALASRDVSLDFSRAGTASKQANKIIAFFNATLQGTDKMVRAFKDNPIGSTTKAVTGITIPSIALYMINRNDKRYQELPQWQKDLFWIIPTKKRLYRIPKPFELGIIFGSVPERIMQWVDTNDKKAFDGIGKTLAEGMLPSVIPTALLPYIEAASNYSFFKRHPIVPQSQQKQEPWSQYSVYTSETAKLVGKALNVSPRIIENTLYGYGGGLSRYGLDITDVILETLGAVEKAEMPKEGIEAWPLIRGFTIQKSQSSQSINEFYERLDELERKYGTSKQEKTKFKEGAELAKLRKYSDMLGQYRKKIDSTYKSKMYTSEKKSELIEKYIDKMINIARKAMGKD